MPAYSGPPEGFGAGAYRDQQATAPVVLSRVNPEYTSDAFRRKVEGLVTLEVLVRQDGQVGQVRVQTPLDPDLNPNAMCAAAQWRFRPALLDGRPVDYVLTIVLEFRHRSEAGASGGFE